MKLSLIVPCYNEEESVNEFYLKTKNTLKNYWPDTEMIFINDGSQDNTIKILKNIYNQDKPHIKIIDFSRNFGKESALLAGLRASQGEFVGIIDADMQQNPKYILKMLEFLESHDEYDSVATYQEKRKEGKILTLFKSAFYKLMKNLTEIDIVHSASDFRVFRRNVVEAIISLPERCRFSKGIFAWVGFNTYYIPYEVEKRIYGKSKWSFWKLFIYALDGIVAFSTKPLIISAVVGLVFCLFSAVGIAVTVFKTLVFGEAVQGYPTLATLILFASGVQLFFLGI
jgi:glucosyltransferase